jgi:hypothetical protein
MLIESRRFENRASACGVSLLLLATILILPLAATAQLAVTDAGKLVNENTGEELGALQLFVEVNYGQSTPKFDGLGEDFNTVGMMELKLGFTALRDRAPGITRFLESYAFGSTFDEGLNGSGSDEDGDVRAEFGRFGGGNRLGYGYGDLNGSFSLYNQNSLNWTKVKPQAYDASSPGAQAVFDRFGDSYHFGALVEGGFKYNVSSKVAVSLGAEGALIYPRYVFWPWLGSVAIYSGVQSALEVVGARIIESNPKFGPVLYFVLKSGASLGYYLLAQQDMNWPFDSETPMAMESAKLGLSVGF